MSTWGIDSVSNALKEVAAGGEFEVMPLKLDEDATAAIGQVLQYNASEHNFVNRTTGVTSGPYAVCLEAKTLTADTFCVCLVEGDVNLKALDATSQAEADIVGALLSQGIRVLDPSGV